MKKKKTVPPNRLEKSSQRFPLQVKNLNAGQLARELAERTRLIRDAVVRQGLNPAATFNGPDEKNHIPGFYCAFKKYLAHDLSKNEFADLYSQTVTFCLFTAATRCHVHGETFTLQNASRYIPYTNGILHELFEFISHGEMPRQLKGILEEMVHLLNGLNTTTILQDYFLSTKGEVPVHYFYERLLAEYDPLVREKRGVYYTPRALVTFIVKSLHLILQEKLTLPDGLADTGLKILDPAAGTSTFLAETAQLAVDHYVKKYGEGSKKEFVRHYLLNNLYGFELMMAPYAVAYLKMASILERAGGRLNERNRLNIYLTNTLEREDIEPADLPGMSTLSRESRRAGEIKKKTRIDVILGNPPYSGHSPTNSVELSLRRPGGSFEKPPPCFPGPPQNFLLEHHFPDSTVLTTGTRTKTRKANTWINEQLDAYKQMDGKRLPEKNLKWLQDDYVKFIRFAQVKIDETGEGVVGFVTNHSYLDNPTFRGMRRSLLDSFDEIYILNLHGSVMKKEKCPDSSKDENVFNIRQGVAISFFIKKKNGGKDLGPPPSIVFDDQKPFREKVSGLPKAFYNQKFWEVSGPFFKRVLTNCRNLRGECRVFYADLWGTRATKFELLGQEDINTIKWQQIFPGPGFYLFVPAAPGKETRTGKSLYEKFHKITAIFPVHSVGIVTARDKLTIKESEEEMYRTLVNFSTMEEALARRAFNLGEDTRDWQVKQARQDVRDSGTDREKIVPILYRPFELRYTYYTGKSRGFLCMPRQGVMKHMLQENLGLITVRQVAEGKFNHCFVSETMVESRITTSNKGIAYLFPLNLYLYPDKGKKDLFNRGSAEMPRHPNIDAKFYDLPRESGGFHPLPGIEEIFYYIYAVLFSNIYRETYASYLKIDFPRIPFPEDRDLFMEMAQWGKKLADLHLLKSAELEQTVSKFEIQGDRRVEKIRWEPLKHGETGKTSKGRVYINNTQYFSGISREMWEYGLCGYPVMSKWLKDRKGRILGGEDVKHYIRISGAVRLTIRYRQEIDRLYPLIERHLIVIPGV